MRFGSVCSGIEAASVAWHPLGWQAAWLSEIEPFPSAVLAHHYPDVPNLGDMTTLPERILSGEVEAPDLFCGGTPCQAFSVAGLRNSLDDARGNLSLTFVGIANAIDHVRSVRRDDPAIIFWENVPGVLSTKDNAFGCFLAALAGEDEPIIPSGEKWTNAGCVYGPQRAVAWRVLDAQYFGVAQRRRRVFVVASARDDFDPAAVLFEFGGVRRDTAPSREAGKTVAPTVTNGPPFSRTGNERVEAEAMVLMDQGGSVMNIEYDMVGTRRRETHGHEPVIVQPYEVGNCLTARMAKGINSTLDEGRTPVISIHPHCIGRAPEAGPQGKEYLLDGSAYCMDSRGQPQAVVQPIPLGTKQGLEDQHVNAGCPLFVPAQTFSIPAIGHIVKDDVASTMTRHTGSGSGETQNPAFVAQPIPLNSMNALRSADADPTTGCGIGEAGEAMFTLTKGQHHAVATVAAFKGGQGSSAGGIGYDEYVSPTLSAADSGSNRTPALLTAMQVRRLTPVECERLQGFPDNYTNIPWRKKPEAPDGPRYKALGNSWAVPVVRWIGQRITDHLNPQD